MSSFLVVFVMTFTTITVVGIGILAAYGAVIGILQAFAYRTQRPSTRTLVLVPSQFTASGD